MKSMRKIFVTLIAVALAACCMFTFCACGEKPADPTGGVTLSPTPGAGNIGDVADTDADKDGTEFESANSSQDVGAGSFTPSTALTPDPTPATEGLEFRLNADGKSFRVYDYVGEATDVYIPYTYMKGSEVLPVTEIGYRAFAETDIESVDIPDSVTKLGDYAFRGCSKLEAIDIHKALVDIPTYTFADCESLATITVEADHPKYVVKNNCLIEGSTLILGCKSSVIPDDGSVTSIGEGAFRGVAHLGSITVPEHITSIGNGAFMGCSALSRIELPATVTKISDNLFSGCVSLEGFTIKDTVTEIGYAAFRNCAKLVAIDVPLSVTEIGAYAFAGCTKASSLTFHDISYTAAPIAEAVTTGLTKIGDAAFQGCELIAGRIEIPSSVTSVGANAFQGCIAITNVNFNETFKIFTNKADADAAKKYGAFIFKTVNADGETVYVSPASNLDSIGRAAFYNCAALKTVNIPYTVESLGAYAFYGCVANGFHIYFSHLGLRATWETGWNYVNHHREVINAAKAQYKYTVITAITTKSSEDALTSMEFAWKYVVNADNRIDQCDWTTFLYKDPTDGMNKEYIYSATMPATLGMYWHYSEETGEPVVWTEFADMIYSEAKPAYPGVYWHYVKGIPTAWEDDFTGWTYSETVPTTVGAFWHYDENNKPVAWAEFDGWTLSEKMPTVLGNYWHLDASKKPVAWTEFNGWTYSETEPTEAGKFWHYVDTRPTEWPPYVE